MNPSPNAAPAPIRLALIEDSVAYAAELTTFLNQLPDMGVLGAYTEAKAALAGLAKLTVDVVISDIGLPDCSGIELIPKIRALQPQAEVMMRGPLI